MIESAPQFYRHQEFLAWAGFILTYLEQFLSRCLLFLAISSFGWIGGSRFPTPTISNYKTHPDAQASAINLFLNIASFLSGYLKFVAPPNSKA